MLTVHYGKWALTWEDIGEGFNGDYDPDDPKDLPLLRATLDHLDANDSLSDASYCTLAPVGTPVAVLQAFSEDLFRCLPLSPDDGSYKRTMQEWTWRTEP